MAGRDATGLADNRVEVAYDEVPAGVAQLVEQRICNAKAVGSSPSSGLVDEYVYAWGNNARRAQLKGRRCVVEARGRMGTVLVRFLDTGERVTTSRRALKLAPPQ